ncbi:MAG: flagellar protein FlgN [Gammaproteobacteria bacterium]|nr:flagellar protein FlgN [Gammaproteobacteria bacterium]
METAQLIKAFTATVQASLHGLQSIEPVLRREQSALTGKDPAQLEQVVREKLALLKQLEHSVQARDRLQKAAGLEQGLEGGSGLVATLNLPKLTADWQALNRLAETVAHLNDQNGQLANQGQRATRTALGILTGRSEKEHTYSTLRRKNGGASSYSLGKV